MRRLRAHPVAVTVVALALAVGAVIAIAAAYGFTNFGQAFRHLNFGWLALLVCAQALGIAAYAISYRSVARMQSGPDLSLPLVLRVVTAGFGPFVAGGGFALDKRALHAIADDEQGATLKVLGLGALEWAVLAPAACVAAAVLLAIGDARPMRSLLWPWVIAVPVGFAIGLWLAAPERRRRLADGGGRWRRGLGHGLHAVGLLRGLARDFPSCWQAWIGIALYWALDIASFYGAARFIGMHLNGGEVIVAYATGYALTRRSMPLGGAGVTEVLMTFALHWVGQPVALSLAVVVVYRLFNFVLPAIPALRIHPDVKPLLDAADLGRTPVLTERRRAAGRLQLDRH